MIRIRVNNHFYAFGSPGRLVCGEFRDIIGFEKTMVLIRVTLRQ
jgi:hypothetical protein